MELRDMFVIQLLMVLVILIESLLLWHYIKLEKNCLAYIGKLQEIIAHMTKTFSESSHVKNIHVHVDAFEDGEDESGGRDHDESDDDKTDSL